MAHTYARSYALVRLTLSAATALVVDDYITGATSGAVGIIARVPTTTTIDVYEMSATAFAPTENVANVAGTTESCTATIASPSADLPADAAEVIGSDSTVTDIFRKVADIAGIGGVSNPSSTQAWLGLEMTVYFGREGQSTDTYVLTYEENVRLGYTGAQGQVRCIGSSSNSTSFQNGFHKYKDNDLANFPPAYTESGSIIDIRCVNRGAPNTGSVAFEVDVYSFAYWNTCTFKGDGKINGSNYNNAGETRFVKVRYLNFTGFFANNFGSKLYVYHLYGQELIQSMFFLPEPPTSTDGIYQSNSAGCNTFFSFGFNWEATAFDVISNNANGEPGTDSLLATGFSDNVMHCVNSVVDVTKFTSIFLGRGTSLKELSLKLTVQDELGNPIEGASVNIENQYTKALFRITDVILDTTPAVNATQTTIPFVTDHGLSVGDSFRVSSEEMTVLTVPSTTTVTVTRGANGTAGIIHANHGTDMSATGDHQVLAIAEIGVTNASGVIDYSSSGNGKNAIVLETASFANNSTIITGTNIEYTDFNITVSKNGYKTIKEPITISGSGGIDCGITLSQVLDTNISKRVKTFVQ